MKSKRRFRVFLQQCVAVFTVCSLVLATAIALSPGSFAGTSFSDVEGHWAEDVIMRMTQQGVFSGRGDGKFYPNDRVTVGEFITMVVKLRQLPLRDSVAGEHWSRKFVDAAIERKYVFGWNDIWEVPDKHILREEAFRIIYNAIIETEPKYQRTIATAVAVDFTDIDKTSNQNLDGTYGCIVKGIVSGYEPDTGTEIRPRGYLTRAEATILLERLRDASKRAEYVPNDSLLKFTGSEGTTFYTSADKAEFIQVSKKLVESVNEDVEDLYDYVSIGRDMGHYISESKSFFDAVRRQEGGVFTKEFVSLNMSNERDGTTLSTTPYRMLFGFMKNDTRDRVFFYETLERIEPVLQIIFEDETNDFIELCDEWLSYSFSSAKSTQTETTFNHRKVIITGLSDGFEVSISFQDTLTSPLSSND